MPFPLGHPPATTLYLVLYAVTLAVHVVLMGYVLAGSAWVAAAALSRGEPGPVTALLRDWLPFALGAAITAGVAPLLFVQVLYQAPFYTANLLLFHRWMAVVPVLVVGFYLLYLAKSGVVRRRALRVAVTSVAFSCFAFTAWSWTENHLLMLDRAAWPELYRTGAMLYRRPEVYVRLALWLGGSFAVLGVLAGAQLWRAGTTAAAEWRKLAGASLAGWLVAVLAGGVYVTMIEGLEPGVHAVALGVAAATQVTTWVFQLRADARRGVLLAVAGGALVVSVLAVIALRETMRMATLDVASFYEDHARLAQSGGLWGFIAFLVINAVAIGWIVRRLGRALGGGD